MAHLHKLEKWRHAETKRRAVISPIFGTDGSVSVLFFEYRQRYANEEKQFRYLSDARDYLKSSGYSVGGLKMAKQFDDVSCKYGAPMGRHSNGFLETDMPRFVRLFRVRLDSGGYDDGGAYWGHGDPLWCAIDDDGNRQFVRAYSRTRAAIQLGIPNKALKIGLPDWVSYGMALIDGRAPMPSGVTESNVIEWLRRSGANI